MKEIRTQVGASIYLETLANAVTATGVIMPAALVSPQLAMRSFMASSTGSATVSIEVSNDNVVWLSYITLSPIAGTPDGYADACPWSYIRANVTAVSGSVTVTMGC